ncbi:hypothetical protein BGZ93_010089 [Podila epicladia]|nr:hypothetical protein BGZ93_010089 [Podila epicladia]
MPISDFALKLMSSVKTLVIAGMATYHQGPAAQRSLRDPRSSGFILSIGETIVMASSEDWSWLWRICGQVDEIEVRDISADFALDLAKGIRVWMTHLDTARFGKNWPPTEIEDGMISTILATGTRGWNALERLAVQVTGLPQLTTQAAAKQLTDVRHYFEIHQLVCERLGHFTNLRVLQLGWSPYSIHSKTVYWDTLENAAPSTQNACVNLTLKTGLGKLVNLKRLEELHIINMDHQVMEELMWMAEQWPRLWKIHGLNLDTAARRWPLLNRPKIQLWP